MSDFTNPPLPAEPAPETTLNDNTTNDQPPLPDEPAPTPTPTSHVSSKPSTTVVEEAEDEDAPFAGASSGKGKGKGKQQASLTDGDDAQEAEEEEWDPSAVESRSLKDRKAAEEKPMTSNQQNTGKQGDGQPVSADTGGWQAIWAPAQNGKRSLLPVPTLPQRCCGMMNCCSYSIFGDRLQRTTSGTRIPALSNGRIH